MWLTLLLVCACSPLKTLWHLQISALIDRPGKPAEAVVHGLRVSLKNFAELRPVNVLKDGRMLD